MKTNKQAKIWVLQVLKMSSSITSARIFYPQPHTLSQVFGFWIWIFIFSRIMTSKSQIARTWNQEFLMSISVSGWMFCMEELSNPVLYNLTPLQKKKKSSLHPLILYIPCSYSVLLKWDFLNVWLISFHIISHSF